jgi:RNA polymerase sigma-70 factor, ECF subfamily
MTTSPTEREDLFRSLYADAYDDVLRFAQRRSPESAAEDVVAEVFLVAWRRLDDAPSRPQDLRPWLFGIARNCLLNAQRVQGRREALAVRLTGASTIGQPSTPSDIDAVAVRFDLAAAWQRLTAGDQEVLALRVFENLTAPEAGHVLGITSTAYRIRLMRARRHVRRELDYTTLEFPAPTISKDLSP